MMVKNLTSMVDSQKHVNIGNSLIVKVLGTK